MARFARDLSRSEVAEAALLTGADGVGVRSERGGRHCVPFPRAFGSPKVDATLIGVCCEDHCIFCIHVLSQTEASQRPPSQMCENSGHYPNGPIGEPLSSTSLRMSSLSVATFRRHYLRQEPYAVVPHIRICAGGGPKGPPLLRSVWFV